MHRSFISSLLPFLIFIHSTTASPNPQTPTLTNAGPPGLYCIHDFPLPAGYANPISFCSSVYGATCNNSELSLPALGASGYVTLTTTSATTMSTSTLTPPSSTSTCTPTIVGGSPVPCLHQAAGPLVSQGSPEQYWSACRSACTCASVGDVQEEEEGEGE